MPKEIVKVKVDSSEKDGWKYAADKLSLDSLSSMVRIAVRAFIREQMSKRKGRK